MRRATLAGLLAIALIAAGCGGGGSGDSTSGAGTKSAYLTKGNQICAQTTYLMAQAARDRFGTSTPPRPQQLQYVREVVVPAFSDLIRKLRALQPPPGDGSRTAAIYDALERGVKQLKSDPSLYLKPPVRVFDQASRLARQYGFTQCGQR